MIRENLENREAEIIRTLSSLPKGFVVIGGYATSALAVHRFSVDCDIVVSRKDLPEFRIHLAKQGYKKEKSAKGFDQTYQSEVEVYVKKIGDAPVSMDLFINGVTSRTTKASWSYEHVFENSIEAIVSGVGSSTEVKVPAKELLMAMKIHSGRDVDMRDIVMLCEDVDWDYVRKHVARGKREILLEQLTRMINKMTEDQFTQSLRATFEVRRDISPLVSYCRKNLAKLRTDMEQLFGKYPMGDVQNIKDELRDERADN